MKQNYIFCIAIIVFALTAIFSEGFYHPDEHYQIIEFANYKLGNTNDLAWEFSAMIRPTLQPSLCYLIFRFLKIFGIVNPYTLALILRLLTAAFALSTIKLFISRSEQYFIKDLRLPYAIIFYSLWFIAPISVRFSSETWSGLSFMMALSFIIRPAPKKHDFCYSGLFLGLSFLFRFQTGFLILGLLLWLILVGRERLINLLILLIISSLILQVGLLIDFWFYGTHTCTFWNYFVFNIRYDVASVFGVTPWYEILKHVLLTPIWPLGVIILTSFLIVLIKKPKNIIIWCIFPFLAIHFLIPHKELRFLFPLVWFIPFIIIMGIQETNILGYFQKRRLFILKATLLLIFLTVNFIALVVVTFKAGDDGQKKITRYVYEHFRQQKVLLNYAGNSNPYDYSTELSESFYITNNVKTCKVNDRSTLFGIEKANDTVYLLSLREGDVQAFPPDLKNKIVLLSRGIPKWIDVFRSLYEKEHTGRSFMLYRIVN